MVCTGTTGDYRDPGYFAGLQEGLARSGIIPRVHILGMVPKIDQIELLKGSIALIQPTLFEGGPGGGAAYDAVSLGVRCVLSDIAVNREIANEPGIRLFAARDPAALAEALLDVGQTPEPPRPDASVLMRQGHARRAACGAQLLAAIEFARSKR